MSTIVTFYLSFNPSSKRWSLYKFWIDNEEFPMLNLGLKYYFIDIKKEIFDPVSALNEADKVHLVITDAQIFFSMKSTIIMDLRDDDCPTSTFSTHKIIKVFNEIAEAREPWLDISYLRSKLQPLFVIKMREVKEDIHRTSKSLDNGKYYWIASNARVRILMPSVITDREATDVIKNLFLELKEIDLSSYIGCAKLNNLQLRGIVDDNTV